MVGRKLVAEAAGTFILVFFAVGSAIFGIQTIGEAGVAFAFGLVLVALAYAIGPVSGCHVNPAVTLGVLLARRMSPREAGGYVAAPLVGAIVAGAVRKGCVTGGGITDPAGALGTNGWGKTINGGGAFAIEVLLTALFVLVGVLVPGRATAPGFAGLAIGLALATVHFVGINLTGTSVNPARSIGPALFAGPEALKQLWLFIVPTLVGALLAAVVWPLVRADDDVNPPRAESVEAVAEAAKSAAAVPRQS